MWQGLLDRGTVRHMDKHGRRSGMRGKQRQPQQVEAIGTLLQLLLPCVSRLQPDAHAKAKAGLSSRDSAKQSSSVRSGTVAAGERRCLPCPQAQLSKGRKRAMQMNTLQHECNSRQGGRMAEQHVRADMACWAGLPCRPLTGP